MLYEKSYDLSSASKQFYSKSKKSSGPGIG
jgi:hypothetical protein